jgi:hypothetical protein
MPLFMPHTDHKQEASRATDHHVTTPVRRFGTLLAILSSSPPPWRISRSQLPPDRPWSNQREGVVSEQRRGGRTSLLLLLLDYSRKVGMGRSPCCDKDGLKRGPWTPEEDQNLLAYIDQHGHGCWRSLPAKAGTLFLPSLAY